MPTIRVNLPTFLVFLANELNILIVGLQKILSLLEAEDADVRIHAVKVVANLAAEGVYISLHYYSVLSLAHSELPCQIVLAPWSYVIATCSIQSSSFSNSCIMLVI